VCLVTCIILPITKTLEVDHLLRRHYCSLNLIIALIFLPEFKLNDCLNIFTHYWLVFHEHTIAKKSQLNLISGYSYF
jgi:hypothetical protein